jgi:pilus assembly protein Flp/PilA
MCQSFQETETITLHKRKVTTMLNAIRQFVKDEEGASAAEYALILALVTAGMAAAASALGNAVTGAISTATNQITGS